MSIAAKATSSSMVAGAGGLRQVCHCIMSLDLIRVRSRLFDHFEGNLKPALLIIIAVNVCVEA